MTWAPKSSTQARCRACSTEVFAITAAQKAVISALAKAAGAAFGFCVAKLLASSPAELPGIGKLGLPRSAVAVATISCGTNCRHWRGRRAFRQRASGSGRRGYARPGLPRSRQSPDTGRLTPALTHHPPPAWRSDAALRLSDKPARCWPRSPGNKPPLVRRPPPPRRRPAPLSGRLRPDRQFSDRLPGSLQRDRLRPADWDRSCQGLRPPGGI